MNSGTRHKIFLGGSEDEGLRGGLRSLLVDNVKQFVDQQGLRLVFMGTFPAFVHFFISMLTFSKS